MDVRSSTGQNVTGRSLSHAKRLRWFAILLTGDLAALGVAFALPPLFIDAPTSWPRVFAVSLPIYLGTAINSEAYTLKALQSVSAGVHSALRSLLFTSLALFLISYFLRVENDLPRLLLAVTMAFAAVLVVSERLFLARMIRTASHRRPFVAEMVITDRLNMAVPRHMQFIHAERADLRPDLQDPLMLDRFASLIRGVDRVIIACPPEARQAWAMLLKGANVRGEVVAPEVSAVGALGVNSLMEQPTFIVSTGPLQVRDRIIKRTFDLMICVPALLALAPVLLLTAIAVKLDSRGPILFRQRRVGRGNAMFEIFKFRSMRVEMCDADGRVSTGRDDDRITRVGRFIRGTSIDELPQLFNVLLGSMSVVGPRPHALGSVAEEQLFWEVDERYWHRHAIKPGITGLAQVRGFRGATHRRADLTQRLQADLEYLNDWSMWRDVTILARTLTVVMGKNVY